MILTAAVISKTVLRKRLFMSNPYDRLKVIQKKINFIETICREDGSITKSLSDEKRSRASILMHLTSIAEQFNKLAEDAEFDILSQFDKDDLKGSYDVRNYIAHDHEGVNLSVIEHIIRDKLPKINTIIEQLLSPIERVSRAQKQDYVGDECADDGLK